MTVVPVPTLQTNVVHGAAAVLAKQLSAKLQQPTTVVCEAVAVYEAVHVAAHE